MKYILGVDLGTSSIKLLLVNQEGKIIDVEQKEYVLITLKRGYSEQDPYVWTNSFDFCFKNLIDRNKNIIENLSSISFSGQMHSLVLLDKEGKILRNAILWNDTRTTKECNFLNSKYLEILKNEAFNIALDGFTLPKLLWVKENEPKIFSKIDCLMLPKDYLVFYLTNQKQMELTDAAGTLILNMNSNTWNNNFLEKLGINPKIMPKLNSSTTLVSYLSDEIKSKFNLKNDIKVFSGAADNVCGAIGSGLIDEKKALISIGTSGVLVKLTKQNLFNGQLHYFNYVDNLKYCMGVTLGAGISLKWFKNNILESNLNYNEFLKDLDTVKLDENNVIFTPWLFGERTPYLDANIRGTFIGLEYKQKNIDLIKAIMEGITFSLNTCKNIYEKNTDEKISSIISTGGGSNNNIWLQMQADIFNSEVSTIDNSQGPALGACIIAAVSDGFYKNFNECIDKWIKITKTFKPIKNNVLIYKKLFAKYSKIYELVKQINIE